MTVILALCVFAVAFASPNDQIEKYDSKVKTYHVHVPGKDPIAIIEKADDRTFKDDSFELKEDDEDAKNKMTHIIHDVGGGSPRCYGPSCQDGFNGDEGPHEGYEDSLIDEKNIKDYRDFSKERLQAINALAAKLKKEKLKADRYSYVDNNEEEDDNGGKIYTTWNKLKVKQHKHPYDDKDGWVSLEPVAWSTSKISKWKPNVKKQKPNIASWNEDDDRFPNDDRYTSYHENANGYSYSQKPSMSRPGFINNKLHTPIEYDSEVPSRPSWNKLHQQSTYPSSWSPDEGRRPHKPNCDSENNNPNDDSVYYEISDSVVTDNRPTHFPYEYEALHQSTNQKRPIRRPTQVVYAGTPELDTDRNTRPPHGDGQWVLLSTTKGYRSKKRQRSMKLTTPADDRSDQYGSMTSHQAVALTVLPVDNAHTNMTTSHGGLLEVEKSFKTVEESKRDMDKKHDLNVAATQYRPIKTRVIRRKIGTNNVPDSSTILAAVGAGMVPATMAMVVPMMLGKRRRRRDVDSLEMLNIDNLVYRQ
jgi:hypothetical protein